MRRTLFSRATASLVIVGLLLDPNIAAAISQYSSPTSSVLLHRHTVASELSCQAFANPSLAFARLRHELSPKVLRMTLGSLFRSRVSSNPSGDSTPWQFFRKIPLVYFQIGVFGTMLMLHVPLALIIAMNIFIDIFTKVLQRRRASLNFEIPRIVTPLLLMSGVIISFALAMKDILSPTLFGVMMSSGLLALVLWTPEFGDRLYSVWMSLSGQTTRVKADRLALRTLTHGIYLTLLENLFSVSMRPDERRRAVEKLSARSHIRIRSIAFIKLFGSFGAIFVGLRAMVIGLIDRQTFLYTLIKKQYPDFVLPQPTPYAQALESIFIDASGFAVFLLLLASASVLVVSRKRSEFNPIDNELYIDPSDFHHPLKGSGAIAVAALPYLKNRLSVLQSDRLHLAVEFLTLLDLNASPFPSTEPAHLFDWLLHLNDRQQAALDLLPSSKDSHIRMPKEEFAAGFLAVKKAEQYPFRPSAYRETMNELDSNLRLHPFAGTYFATHQGPSWALLGAATALCDPTKSGRERSAKAWQFLTTIGAGESTIGALQQIGVVEKYDSPMPRTSPPNIKTTADESTDDKELPQHFTIVLNDGRSVPIEQFQKNGDRTIYEGVFGRESIIFSCSVLNDRLQWESIQVSFDPDQADHLRRRGAALAVGQWLLDQSRRRFPQEAMPLELQLVNNPQMLRVAYKLFDPKTIEVFLPLEDVRPWRPIDEVDLYHTLGPLRIYAPEGGVAEAYSGEEIVAEKGPNGYHTVEHPAGLDVSFDGPFVSVKDRASQTLLDWAKFTISFALRGKPATPTTITIPSPSQQPIPTFPTTTSRAA